MEKRKAISLRSYFTAMLLLFFVGIVAIFALAIAALMLCMRAGIVVPANSGEKEAQAEIIRQSESAAFTHDLAPSFYDYIFFDENGNVAASSLEGGALSRALERYKQENVSYGTGTYVFYGDGSRCLFIWRYEAGYKSSSLRKNLPNAEQMTLVVTVCASILFFLLFVRGMSRKLGSKLAFVESASNQIAGQNLDTPIDSAAGIKEFNHALKSMDDMRSALKDALIGQWEAEQQRKQEIAALAHDIKTPLTVISGNAELLLEEDINAEQSALVNSIHKAGTRAQQYMSALQQISVMDMRGEKAEKMEIMPMLNEIDAFLSPLASDKAISIEYTCGENLHTLTACYDLLTRALSNILENAIRFTKTGGKITISVCQNEEETLFSIQDGGPGFSKAAMQHAKEMLWQQDASRSGSRNYGIGLFVAEKVAKKHQGQLILQNTPQGGCVKLRIARQQDDLEK